MAIIKFKNGGSVVKVPMVNTTFTSDEIALLIKDNLKFEVVGIDLKVSFNGEVFESIQLPSNSSGIPCASITVEDVNISINKNSSAQIITYPKPVNTTDTVTYYTNNQNIATVDENGVISWVSGGTVVIEVCCGTRSTQVTVTCDKLLNTTYSVKNISQDQTLISCEDDDFVLSYTGVTNNSWSVSGSDIIEEENQETITIGYNLTNAPIAVSGNILWNGMKVPYNYIQYQYGVLPIHYEFNGSATLAGYLLKSSSDAINRRAIGKLNDISSDTNFVYNICNKQNQSYDLMYIPAKVTELKLLWNTDNGNIEFAPNVYLRTGERYYDAGWGNHSGEIAIDLSGIDEGCWYGGNVRMLLNGTDEQYSRISFDSLYPRYTVQFEDLWEELSGFIPTYKSNDKVMRSSDIYNNYLYQFYDTTGGIKKYNMNDLSAVPEDIEAIDSQLSYTSACFSNIKQYTKNGQTITTQTPLIFVTGNYKISNIDYQIIDIFDLDNQTLVKQYLLPGKKTECIAAWDFENMKCWLFGYEHAATLSTGNWYVDEYVFDSFTDQSTTYVCDDSYFLSNTFNNTLVDCKYYNGSVYILSGGGATKKQTGCIWKFNITDKTIYYKSVSEDSREFKSIVFNNNTMVATNTSKVYTVKQKFDCVTNINKNQLDVKQVDIQQLKNQGCTNVETVYEQYPDILTAMNGSIGLLFDGASYFQTDIVPDYTDTITVKFTINEQTTTAKTLWCSRANSANSFTAFIISMALRADSGSQLNASQYTLQTDKLYEYSQNVSTGIITLNSVLKNIPINVFTPVNKITFGGSYEGVNTSTGDANNVRNFLNKATLHSFSIKDSNNKYRRYYVPIADNTVVDLVTGVSITNRGTGNANLTE